ncbi:MAG TPA: dipeptidase PepV [Chthonomonadales bacterium]|nr:dipeptidase PepV [Chthonomonadales bacterium]
MNSEIILLHSWIDAHRDEIVEALCGVLRIPSKKEAPAGPDAPFGRPLREALDYTLNLCRTLGFRVKDVDGYAGHAEFGEGEEMVAALGHLDVVPEGDGWQHPPFGAAIDDGYIYARGAADDKGPTYATLFAAKALMESGLPLRRRVRVIFGCDEESGFGCVKHYWEVAKEERPVLAFTPDASFPLIYAEKGISNLVLERHLETKEAPLRVIEARGGLRANMVPESAEARIIGEPAALYGAVVALMRHWDKNIRFEPDAKGIWVRASGKSAHGSKPLAGDNAIGRLAHALLQVDLPIDRPWLSWIVKTVDGFGEGLGLQARDDIAGPLTNNLGILEMEGNLVRLTYNIRYPVTWTINELLARLQPVQEAKGWNLTRHTDSPPLYVPLDEEPVKTLLRVYREETGDTETQPGTMGGGTYARATPHAVAFGAGFPNGSDGPPHEPDERIGIDSLLRATKIYAHAFYELAK